MMHNRPPPRWRVQRWLLGTAVVLIGCSVDEAPTGASSRSGNLTAASEPASTTMIVWN